ncbi:MAG: hypothetical protein IH908_15035 [Proteobacteria bacterium]|nr:hypothetical protein [Pseudomonadota bacterium]
MARPADTVTLDPLMETPTMHVDPQMLENSFEPVQNGAKPSMEGKARDPAVEDFTAFFEKLSAIDDLHWSSTVERSPAGKQTGSSTGTSLRPGRTLCRRMLVEFLSGPSSQTLQR